MFRPSLYDGPVVKVKKIDSGCSDAGAIPARVGRKRDPRLEGDILDAAREVLIETGYDGMTMDLVAARAGTGKAALYRRWASKAELVLDVVVRAKQSQMAQCQLPDTGTLRGDLLALFKPHSMEEGERKLKLMAGLASAMQQNAELAAAGNAAVVAPWAAAHRALIERAVERGETRPDADLDMLSQVVPSMVAYRTLVRREAFTREFLESLIDSVLLPALMR